MKIASILSSIFTLIWGLAESTMVCTYCKCITYQGPLSKLEIDCTRSLLNIMPPVTDWSQNATSLDFGFNNISSILVEMTHSHLETLKLNHNKISSIVPSAFGGLQKLKYLDLSNNFLRTVEMQTFYGLEFLEVLNISHNLLKIVPENTFFNMFELEVLNLAGNPIVHLESIIFKKMLNLKRLDIANTGTYYLPDSIFSTLDSLEYLDISANDFHTVPTNALRSASGLKFLRLNQNPIERLEKMSFTKLKSLEVLEMNYMDKLLSIGPRTFSDMENLRVLRANANHQLTNIDSDAFAGLFTTKKVPTLQEVSLEMNKLSQLHGKTFPCSKIEIFNLQKNPWHCDCNIKWLKKCQTPEVYTADLKCQSPSMFHGSLLRNIAEQDLSCETYSSPSASDIHHDRVLRLTSVVLGCVMLVAMALTIIVVLKWKGIKNWWKSKKKGTGSVYYVRAHTNPMEAQ